MIINHAYTADIISSIENATMQMQSTLRLVSTNPLPSTTQEITSYVEYLLSVGEQEGCDRATD